MSADRHPRLSRRGRSLLHLAGLVLAAAALALAVAGGATGASPASPSEAASAPAPTPGPSRGPVPHSGDWLFATPQPEPTEPPGTAPPLPDAPSHPETDGANSCYDCHSAVNDKQAAIAADWKGSAHEQAGIGCVDCHGGDATSDQITVAMAASAGFTDAPDRLGVVGLCGSCHSDVNRMRTSGLPTDQYAKYWSSVHGQRLLAANDVRVAVCTDCHGSHDVRKVSDPSAPVFILNVPELCASCHADASRMEPYGIPTDQFEVYSKSVHGEALLEHKDVRAPSCASCHGSHDAQPPTSATVVEVCGKCHTATQELYQQSRHSQLETAAPKCWTCHGTHDVSQPGSRMFFHPTTPDYTCTTCHDLGTRRLRLELSRFTNEADRRCDTCHHPDSQIYAQIQGIATAVGGAEQAYDDAGHRIEEAARLGMITSEAEVTLTGARTSLIQAQAAVHTTKLKVIAQLSTDARAKAEVAQTMARAQVDESSFRRQAMVIVLGLIAVSVLFLVVTKRALDRDLERDQGSR